MVATPTRVELYRPGVPLPGQTIQVQQSPGSGGAATTGTTFVSSGISQNISLSSSANAVRVSVYGYGLAGVLGVGLQIRMQRGATALSQTLLIESNGGSGAGIDAPFSFVFYDWPNALTAQTYAIYFASNSNGNSVTLEQGIIVLEEIMA